MGETKRRRVDWTTSQNEKVGTRAAEIFYAGQAKSDIRAIDQAQKEVLEKDFHRLIKGKTHIQRVKPYFTKRLEELKKANGEPAAASVELDANERRRIARSWLSELAEQSELQDTKIQQAMALLAGELASLFAVELKRELTLTIGAVISESMTEARTRLVAEMQAIKPKQIKPKPTIKVIVVGLLPDQADTIGKEFEDVLDLRFYVSSDRAQRISDAAKHVHAAAIMTDFIGHHIDKAAQSAPRLYRVSGGMTKLRETLTQIYVDLSP